MKNLHTLICLFLACLVVTLASTSGPIRAADKHNHGTHGRMGSHGMAVIGTEDLILYHLALYSFPHDRQIALPGTIANMETRQQFIDWRQSYGGLVTIVPELFDLDRLAPGSDNPLSSFTADVYEGHFERGGKLKFPSVRFEFKAPLLHEQVIETATAENRFTYLEVGMHAYLIRAIGPRPGIDQITRVRRSSTLQHGDQLLSRPITLSTGRQSLQTKENSPVMLDVLSLVYKETADFK